MLWGNQTREPQPENPWVATKILCATSTTWCSQVNKIKYFLKKIPFHSTQKEWTLQTPCSQTSSLQNCVQPPDCTFLLLKRPVSGTLLFAPGNEWKPLISPYCASTFPVSAVALLHRQSLRGYVAGTQYISSLWVTEWPSQGRQKECRTELRERSLGVIFHCVYVLELDLPLLLYGPGKTLTLSEPQFSPQYNGIYKQLMQFNIKKTK